MADGARGELMDERQYYEPVRACIAALLDRGQSEFHVEITASRKFSNLLKSAVGDHRDIVFHFLAQAAPDLTGFIRTQYSADFLVVEVKPSPLKLDDVFQVRKYAELLDAKYAILLSPAEIPEEIKRLHKVQCSLLALPAYKTVTLAQFDLTAGTIVDWYPNQPFDSA